MPRRRINPPQNDPVLNAFLAEIGERFPVVSRSDPRTNYGRSVTVDIGPVRATLTRDSGEGVVVLATIESSARGAGHASAALEAIRSIARKYHVRLRLNADPFGAKADAAGTKRLSKKALVSWYRRHGFRGSAYRMTQENPKRVRSNGLLWQEQEARRLWGQTARGVFTTPVQELAAAYAMDALQNASEWSGALDESNYAVVFALDTEGLPRLLDDDARFWLEERWPEVRSEALRQLDEYGSIDPQEVETGNLSELEGTAVVEAIHSREFAFKRDPFRALVDVYGRDGSEKVVRDDAAVPIELANEVMQQFRYDTEFNEDRVVAIYALKPWWRSVIDTDLPSGRRVAREAERHGWHVVTLEALLSESVGFGEVEALYEGNRHSGQRIEYHGTWSGAARKAFPQTSRWPKKTPFPVTMPEGLDD